MKDGDSKANKNDSSAKYKAILSDYSGFRWLKIVALSLCRTTVVGLHGYNT